MTIQSLSSILDGQTQQVSFHRSATLKPVLTVDVGRPATDSAMATRILFSTGPGALFLNSQVLYPDGDHRFTSNRPCSLLKHHREHSGSAGGNLRLTVSGACQQKPCLIQIWSLIFGIVSAQCILYT